MGRETKTYLAKTKQRSGLTPQVWVSYVIGPRGLPPWGSGTWKVELGNRHDRHREPTGWIHPGDGIHFPSVAEACLIDTTIEQASV